MIHLPFDKQDTKLGLDFDSIKKYKIETIARDNIQQILPELSEKVKEICYEIANNSNKERIIIYIIYGSNPKQNRIRETLVNSLAKCLERLKICSKLSLIDIDKLDNILTIVSGSIIIDLIECLDEICPSLYYKAKLLSGLNKAKGVSIDYPSGVNVSTGAVSCLKSFNAFKTIVLIKNRVSQFIHPARRRYGEVINLPSSFDVTANVDTKRRLNVYERQDIMVSNEKLIVNSSTKYTRGVAALITGSKKFIGAGILSSAAALHGGAGALFHYGEASSQVVKRYPSIISSEQLPSNIRANSVLIGCGLNFTYPLSALLERCKSVDSIVLDADAITEISKDTRIQKMLSPDKVLLIPNVYEAARLLNISDTNYVTDNILQVSVLLYEKLKVSIAIRDINTILIHDGSVYTFDESIFKYQNSLSIAGSGDVFAGILTSVLAARNDIPFATKVMMAVFLHRKSCDLAVSKYQSPIISALDILNVLPYAWKYLISPQIKTS